MGEELGSQNNRDKGDSWDSQNKLSPWMLQLWPDNLPKIESNTKQFIGKHSWPSGELIQLDSLDLCREKYPLTEASRVWKVIPLVIIVTNIIFGLRKSSLILSNKIVLSHSWGNNLEKLFKYLCKYLAKTLTNLMPQQEEADRIDGNNMKMLLCHKC